METIYIEKEVADHPRTLKILARHANARHIEIERYTDVFNAPAQNFRVQKQQPALILASKHGKRVLPTPPEYHIGGQYNYYFSHMLNCIYDCRYCFLQGMYRSANHVVFVNFEDFFDEIAATARAHSEPSWYFSGYDCDSLALEPMTKFVDTALDVFASTPDAHLEIRTKSTQVRGLLARPAIANCVVAFSLSPASIIDAEEHKTPSLAKRIAAIKSLQQHGWRIGLRFDPLLNAANFQQLYGELFDEVFAAIDADALHSVSLGPFRLPGGFYKKMTKLYPESALLAVNMVDRGNTYSYDADTEARLIHFCEQRLFRHIRQNQYFPCVSIT